MSGLVTPTVSGNYIFFISADDHAELWLSTDDKPATVALIASEPDWAGEREWTGNAGGRRGDPAENVSLPQALTAGKSYYIEALWEGRRRWR